MKWASHQIPTTASGVYYLCYLINPIGAQTERREIHQAAVKSDAHTSSLISVSKGQASSITVWWNVLNHPTHAVGYFFASREISYPWISHNYSFAASNEEFWACRYLKRFLVPKIVGSNQSNTPIPFRYPCSHDGSPRVIDSLSSWSHCGSIWQCQSTSTIGCAVQ